MPFRGFLDDTTQFVLRGWACCDTDPSLVPFVDIVLNRRLLATVRAGVFRADLLADGIADGRRGFWFNPFESLSPGPNQVEVYISGSDQLLTNGTCILTPDLQRDRLRFSNSDERSKLRWTNHDEETSLIWGRLMTGDSFLDQVDRLFAFSPESAIFEIGPGYGRLLKTILERGYEFKHFLGLDISKIRVDKLTQEFGNDRISFTEGACDNYQSDTRFDLVISSATCEHLFPSIAATLERMYEHLKDGGILFFDFICHDPNLAISRAYFEENLGEAFIRIYSETELRTLFVLAGFEILDIVYPMVTGLDVGLQEIKRALVCARKPIA